MIINSPIIKVKKQVNDILTGLEKMNGNQK